MKHESGPLMPMNADWATSAPISEIRRAYYRQQRSARLGPARRSDGGNDTRTLADSARSTTWLLIAEIDSKELQSYGRSTNQKGRSKWQRRPSGICPAIISRIAIAMLSVPASS